MCSTPPIVAKAILISLVVGTVALYALGPWRTWSDARCWPGREIGEVCERLPSGGISFRCWWMAATPPGVSIGAKAPDHSIHHP